MLLLFFFHEENGGGNCNKVSKVLTAKIRLFFYNGCDTDICSNKFKMKENSKSMKENFQVLEKPHL